MNKNYSVSRLGSAYILFSTCSLIMYIFGHSTEDGTLPIPDKIFYYPCALALICAFLSKIYWRFNASDALFLCFIILAYLNSIAIGNVNWQHINSCLLGYLIYRQIPNVDVLRLSTYLVWMTPIVIFIHYFFTSPFNYHIGYRYGGFQGDPNCFAMAINILVYSNGYIVNHTDKKAFKVLSYCNILLIAPLILASASRGGILCYFMIIFFSLRNSIKGNKLLVFLMIAALIIGLRGFTRISSEQFNYTVQRFTSKEGADANSADYRYEEFNIAVNLLNNHPEYIPLGIGFSQTHNAHINFREYTHKGRAHNTYMSILMEEGVIGFILFGLFLLSIGKQVWRRRFLIDGYYCLSLLCILLFFMFTIFSLPFLPFWFGLFLSQNSGVTIKK